MIKTGWILSSKSSSSYFTKTFFLQPQTNDLLYFIVVYLLQGRCNEAKDVCANGNVTMVTNIIRSVGLRTLWY